MRASLFILAALLVPAMGQVAALQPGVPLLIDDAASGRDAGDTRDAALAIDLDTLYAAALAPRASSTGLRWLQDQDHFAFHPPVGVNVSVNLQGALACTEVFPPGSVVSVATACGTTGFILGQTLFTANVAGEWVLRVASVDDGFTEQTTYQAYRFQLRTNPSPGTPLIGAPPPEDLRLAAVAPATQTGEHIVIAVIDTGVNPYHAFFAAPALMDHPSAWLTRFPQGAQRIDLSLSAPDLASALSADDAKWRAMQRSHYVAATDSFEEHLYTFPGTRVIAGISFGEYTALAAVAPPQALRPVFDEYGHGTHSAGLALGSALDGADGNVLLVMVETSDFAEGLRWAARQPWIDAISMSAGARAGLPVGDALDASVGERSPIHEAAEAGKPFFISSGNGITATGILPDHCSTWTNSDTGIPWSTRIGAAEPASGAPTWWHCAPVDATARTSIPAPDADSMASVSLATGTSASAPHAAAHWAKLLLEARREGSQVSGPDALDHLLRAARWRQSTGAAVGVDPALGDQAYLTQGYGLIDDAALERALTTLRAGTPTPRPEMEGWRATDDAIRHALWGDGG